MITRLVAYVIANVVAVLAVGTLSSRLISYDSRTALFIFAAVLGVINAYIKPVLKLLALPLTCLTFGLFSLVITVGLFALAAWLTPGMTIEFWGAVLGALIASVASGVIFSVIDERAR